MNDFLRALFESQEYNRNNFFLLAGPCVVENEDLVFEVAERVSDICKKLEIPFVLKSSYRKANRTSSTSYTGPGDMKGLEILQKAAAKYRVPTVTDIHSEPEAAIAAEYVDVLQIPAFLCRQTELLLAAGRTGKVVNVKKGQFLSGESMRFAVDKIKATGNEKIMLTERGTTFGYQDLVVDYRNIPVMQKTGLPVVMDVTHSLQQPNQTSGVTGGNPEMIHTTAAAAIAAGADGISKYAGEFWCNYYFGKYGVDVRSLRYPGLISYKSAPGGGTTDYAVEIFHEALTAGEYKSFLSENTYLPMMYMPDAIRATLELMEAPSEKIKVRTSYNVSSMSFSPREIAAEIKKHIPKFSISYAPDYRQSIADSWPQSIDDSTAREDWGWKHAFDLAKMTEDMIVNLRHSSLIDSSREYHKN